MTARRAMAAFQTRGFLTPGSALGKIGKDVVKCAENLLKEPSATPDGGVNCEEDCRMSKTVKSLLIIAGLLFLPRVGLSQESGPTLETEIQHFHPPVDGQGVVVTESAKTLGLGKPAFGLWFDYANKPLVLYQVDDKTGAVVGDEPQNIVGNHLAMNVQAAIGFKYASLGVNVPINLVMSGETDLGGVIAPASGTAFGDIRVVPKFRLVDPIDKKFGVAIVIPVALPSGNVAKYAGDGQVRIIPKAVLGYQGPKFRTFVNLGAHLRLGGEEVGALDFLPKHEFIFSWAMGIRAHPKVEINTEIWGGIGSGKPDEGNANPVEWAMGLTIRPTAAFALRTGLGTALSPGYGAPAVRAYFSAGVALESNDDADLDGIIDAADQCPAEPEDADGYQDADGCPDVDNDQDGILDVDDDCPNEDETLNGFEDTDGCPDESDDEIVEAPDLELLSGDEDTDGDGVMDADDDCPSDPEDPDGFEDEDGCPDLDNDADDIGDALDECPLEAEVYNGIDDQDGCPDEGLVVIEKQGGKIARIAILQKVFFEVNKAIIKPESYPVLDAVYNVLRAYDSIRLVEVQGHTDSDGSDDKNLTLSQDRAESVRQYLIDKGVMDDRLSARGYGESMPIDTNASDEGKANNRRVEFVVLEQE